MLPCVLHFSKESGLLTGGYDHRRLEELLLSSFAANEQPELLTTLVNATTALSATALSATPLSAAPLSADTLNATQGGRAFPPRLCAGVHESDNTCLNTVLFSLYPITSALDVGSWLGEVRRGARAGRQIAAVANGSLPGVFSFKQSYWGGDQARWASIANALMGQAVYPDHGGAFLKAKWP